MKYLVLAITALGLFSCVNGKNVAENKSQQRTVASFQELGFSDEEGAALVNEIEAVQAQATPKSKSPMEKFAQGMNNAKSFHAVANSTYFSPKQKYAIMKNDTIQARRELRLQTGGSGLRYNYFAGRLNEIDTLLSKRDFKGAANIPLNAAPSVHSTIKALGY